MKKFIAFILSFSILFLCACSDNGEKNSETTTATSEQTTTETASSEGTSNPAVEYVSEWGSDLLPEDFPSPPGGTYDVMIEKGEANNSFSSDWVRMKFTCPENEIYRFTNDFIKAGYMGGAKKIEAPTTYFKSGFNGSWQNGKNLGRVTASEYSKEGMLTLIIDITECKDNFPAVLTSIFPKFNGFSKSSGIYSEYDANKNKTDNEFMGSLYANSWTWEFGYENTFIGVTESELDEYVNELFKAEFAGVSSTSITDGCTVISYDLVKETGTEIYGVFIAYNQILKTMDILYTNDISLLVEV